MGPTPTKTTVVHTSDTRGHLYTPLFNTRWVEGYAKSIPTFHNVVHALSTAQVRFGDLGSYCKVRAYVPVYL